MVGPDKMMVNVVGEAGQKGYWYNGSQMSYYSFSENNYATIDAPATIIETMDSVHRAYGIDFPAADFFYPSFTDDLLSYSSDIDYLGTTTIDGKVCFHILAVGKDMNIQIWVANDATNLPQKLLITYNNHKIILCGMKPVFPNGNSIQICLMLCLIFHHHPVQPRFT